MDSAAPEEDESIFHLAGQCEKSFSLVNAVLKAVNAEFTSLLEEYQYRFLTWTAYLGVFAERDVCLDRRLRHHPELQDIVVRYLDIVQRNLNQLVGCILDSPSSETARSNDPKFSDDSERSEAKTDSGLAPEIETALTAVDQAISRLNRTGIIIRRSSTRRHPTSDIPGDGQFRATVLSSVQALYPFATVELQEYLSDRMAARRNDIMLKQSSQEKRKTRRALETIPENEYPLSTQQQLPPSSQHDFATTREQGEDSKLAAPPASPDPNKPRQSEVSSINTRLLRKHLDQPSIRETQKTLSIRANQIGYPKPPQPAENSNYITCQWCSEIHPKHLLEGRHWLSHVRKDFKPFVCLSEACPEPHFDKEFSRATNWQEHMASKHGSTWHRDVYASLAWVCAFCREDAREFTTPKDLNTHLDAEHYLNEIQREAIVSQSRARVERKPGICPICCMSAGKDDAPTKGFQPGVNNPALEPKPERLPDLAQANVEMAEHIAGHLEKLMLLLIRLMEIEDLDEGQDGDPIQDMSSFAAESGNNASMETLSQDYLSLSASPPISEVAQTDLDDIAEPLSETTLASLSDNAGYYATVDVRGWLGSRSDQPPDLEPLLKDLPASDQSDTGGVESAEMEADTYDKSQAQAMDMMRFWSSPYPPTIDKPKIWSDYLAPVGRNVRDTLWECKHSNDNNPLKACDQRFFSLFRLRQHFEMTHFPCRDEIFLYKCITVIRPTSNGDGAIEWQICQSFCDDISTPCIQCGGNQWETWMYISRRSSSLTSGPSFHQLPNQTELPDQTAESPISEPPGQAEESAIYQPPNPEESNTSQTSDQAEESDASLPTNHPGESQVPQPGAIFSTQPQALLGHTGKVVCVAFSPDGSWLASGSHDKTIRIWHLPTNRCLQTLVGHEGYVNSIAFSPDGLLLASASDDETVMIWQLMSSMCLRVLRGHNSEVWTVAFSPNGGFVASGSRTGDVILWDSATGEVVQVLARHNSMVFRVAFSPDGEVLASCSEDMMIEVSEVAACSPRFVLIGHTDQVWSIAFSSDGQRLVSTSADDTMRIWDMTIGMCVATYNANSGGARAASFSPEGELIASATCGRVVDIWDPEVGWIVQSLNDHTDEVLSVAWSPDGQRIASASFDGTVNLWDRLPVAASGAVVES